MIGKNEEVMMQSSFFLEDDVINLLNDLAIHGSWSQNEVARNVKEQILNLPRYYQMVTRVNK